MNSNEQVVFSAVDVDSNTNEAVLSERQWAGIGFTVIAHMANCLATAYVPWWRNYWSDVVTAATFASYLYQALSMLVAIYERRADKKLSEYTKHVIEMDK